MQDRSGGRRRLRDKLRNFDTGYLWFLPIVLLLVANAAIKVALAPKPLSLEARIEELTGALNSASQTITAIEREVRARQDLVARLQRDARTAEELARANRDQVEAVAQVLRREMDRDQRLDFWLDVSKDVALMFVGTALGVALSEWRQRRAVKPR